MRPDRWIGRDGLITPRSSDLNILNFFVWGYIKNLIEHRLNDRENKVWKVFFNTITPDIAHSASRDTVRRATLFERPNYACKKKDDSLSNCALNTESGLGL